MPRCRDAFVLAGSATVFALTCASAVGAAPVRTGREAPPGKPAGTEIVAARPDLPREVGALPAVASPPAWPCRLFVTVELEAAARLAWQRSATFRTQCRRLATAGAVVVVQGAPPADVWRASSRIGVSPEGITVARIRVGVRGNAVELLSHEIEHVLERIDGVNYMIDARRGGSTMLLPGGAFETRRAIDAGRRVAEEVGHAATPK